VAGVSLQAAITVAGCQRHVTECVALGNDWLQSKRRSLTNGVLVIAKGAERLDSGGVRQQQGGRPGLLAEVRHDARALAWALILGGGLSAAVPEDLRQGTQHRPSRRVSVHYTVQGCAVDSAAHFDAVTITVTSGRRVRVM
jgi:hypothetical protein